MRVFRKFSAARAASPSRLRRAPWIALGTGLLLFAGCGAPSSPPSPGEDPGTAETAVSAGEAVSETVTPDNGRRIVLMAQTCAACHGTGGRVDTAMPAIAGKPRVALEVQLLAFKRDEMPGSTIMPRLVKGYSDEDLIALAAYFAALDPVDQ